jgi:hypothetical protein
MKAQLTIIPIFMLLLSGAALAQGGDSSILVEVKSASGQPVRNACVTLIPKEGEILFSKADREGRLRFRHVTAGDYRIVVKADGYQAQKRLVAFDGSHETFAFMMQPRGTER